MAARRKPTLRQRYRFHHTRKGVFEGVVLKITPTPQDDAVDREFWLVAMDTRDGTGAEHIRRTAGAEVTTTNLRPSLIEKMEKVVKRG